MNNNRYTFLVIAANIGIALVYSIVMWMIGDLLSVILGFATIGSVHIAVCCIAGFFYMVKGRRDIAIGLFISGAILLAVPFILMLF